MNNLIDLYSSFPPNEQLIEECYDEKYISSHSGNAMEYKEVKESPERDQNPNCYIYALNGCMGIDGIRGKEGVPGRKAGLYLQSKDIRLYAIAVLADLYNLRRKASTENEKVQGRIIEIKDFNLGDKPKLKIGKNEYRIALRCDKLGLKYHFMRENINREWSEKHGTADSINHPYGIRPEASYEYLGINRGKGIHDIWNDNSFDGDEIAYLAVTRITGKS